MTECDFRFISQKDMTNELKFRVSHYTLEFFIMINIIEENHNLTWCDLEWESALMHINTSGCP